jgi:uncharacterized protein (TIGR02284 family)
MADYRDDQISVLNELIQTCKDGAEGFQHAAEGVQDPDLRTLFTRYSEQRRQFTAELQTEVRRLGGDPDKTGSVSGALHRGWIDIKSAVTGKDDAAIISEAERGEDVAVKTYEDALKKSLPVDLESIIRRQYSEVKSVHDRVRSLEMARTGKT